MNSNIQKKIDEALLNFYLEADKETISKMLSEDIADIDEYKKKKKKLLFSIKAKAKKQKNKELLDKVANYFEKAIQLNTEKPIAYLKNLISQNSSLAYYHNLEKLTKEDIIDIIKDKNLVDIIERIEDGEFEE